MQKLCPVVLFLLLIMACSGSNPPPRHVEEKKIDSGKLHLPATFTGDLPCADCPGIRHHLDMWPDGAYHLERQWVGRSDIRTELGQWRVDRKRHLLTLTGPDGSTQFEIKSSKRLRLLDAQGNEIESKLNYDLKRTGKFTPDDVSVAMGGTVWLRDDATRFTECMTGRTYQLTTDGDFARVRQAWLDRAHGGPIYMTVEGVIRQREILVTRFINAWPAESCERSRASASLTNTYWRIDHLLGDAVTVEAGSREPRLSLSSGPDGAHYTATVGCNEMPGAFATAGDGITFSATKGPLIGCTAEQEAMEKKLAQALEHTRRWRIIGNTLEFMDESGATTVLFEAVYL
ncbi:MAG TPA: copper resistance protein NlpE N-terminal domain-containing protein [Candidatus Krumholzibacteria bacterium]|nr:copper resistance protein NlpE N-terminal domain-containing protein [Candidatus Krumholzibacteria bacterium]